jgi:hypothetical protein
MPRSDATPAENGAAAKSAPKKKKKKDKLAVANGGVEKSSKKKKQQRSPKSAAKKRVVARPKKSSAAKKKRSAPAAVNYAGVALPSAAAARAVSRNKKEKQAQRMAQYRRRGTLETRVHDFFDKVGGSALLVTATSGGAKRPGRRSLAGSGHYGQQFLDSPLHDRLNEIFEPGMDWRLASKKISMRKFLVELCPDKKTVVDDDDDDDD